jgi:hypothetical protein
MSAARVAIELPEAAVGILAALPAAFKDDGCSNSPDSLFGFNFKWACRIHDSRFCSRSNLAGSMNQSARRRADRELRKFIRQSLPWRWRWVSWVYYGFVRHYGGRAAYNSCGADAGKKCRHNLVQPRWMKALA